jgi:hypothetical protein
MSFPGFEIRRSTSEDQPYYFVLRSKGNGEVILTSEMYTSKQGCAHGIASVKKHAPEDKYYEKRTSTSDQPYFVLKASNGEIIGKSEMYSSTQNRDKGIEAVKRDAPVAGVEEAG